ESKIVKILIVSKDLKLSTYYRIPFLKEANNYVDVNEKLYRVDVEKGDSFSLDKQNIKTFIYVENEPVPASILKTERSIINSTELNLLANDKFVKDIIYETSQKKDINSWLIALG